MTPSGFGAPGVSSAPNTEPQMLLGHSSESASTQSSVAKSGRAGRIAVGGLVGVLALGGAAAAMTALKAPVGPASSDEAVTEFFAALDNEDFVGMAAVMHPAERESLAQPLFDMTGHMTRLEVLGAGADPAAATFLDIEVAGITYSVETVDPGMHMVTTTGGTISAPDNPQPPMGALFDRFDIEMDDLDIAAGGDSGDSDSSRTTSDMGDEPMEMAVVEVDGSWYISLYYSGAEAARREAKEPFPGLGNGPAPIGSESADAVLEDMVVALADLDATAMMTLIDPQEMAVLYDYSPLFLPEMQEAFDDAAAAAQLADVDWTVDSVDFVSSEINGRTVVNFNEIAISFSVGEGELSDEPMEGSLTIAGECTTFILNGETTESCESDAGPEADAARKLADEIIDVLDPSATTIAAFEKLAAVETGITVVERDGRWYVSVVPTSLELINDFLAVLEPADLVAMGTDIEELVDRQDEVAEEILEVLTNTDWEAFGDAQQLAGLESLFNELEGGASSTFVPVAPSLDSSDNDAMTDEEWDAFLAEFQADSDSDSDFSSDGSFDFGNDLGELEGVLAPSIVSPFSVDADGTYLAWFGDIASAPGFVTAAYGSSMNASVEVILFRAPADPTLVLGDDYEVTRDGDSFIASDQFGSTFGFVGNYVVWGDTSSAEGMGLFSEQMSLLAGQ